MPRGGGRGGGGKGDKGVKYLGAPEPSFITEMKKRGGLQPDVTLGDKHAERESRDPGEERDDRDDEAPTIVETAGSLSVVEVETIQKDTKVAAEKAPVDMTTFKPQFKRKRKSGGGELDAEATKTEEVGMVCPAKRYSSKAVKNSGLLSFGEAEEEED